MVEIVDRESAVAWLVEEPRKVQITMAARSAARTLAGLRTDSDLLVKLNAYRAAMICCVAGTSADNAPLRSAAGMALGALKGLAVTQPRDLAVQTAMLSALSVVLRLSITANTAGLRISPADEAAADAIAASAEVFSEEAWTAAASDASRLYAGESSQQLFQYRLWGEAPVPEEIPTDYGALGKFWQERPTVWDFWLRWYEGMFKGQPLDWDLQREVALIPKDNWEKGPEHIAQLIAEIEARYLANAVAERIELAPSGRLIIVPQDFPEDRHLVLSSTRCAMRSTSPPRGFGTSCRRTPIRSACCAGPSRATATTRSGSRWISSGRASA